MPSIFQSFEQIGKTASGVNVLSPSDILTAGIQVAGGLVDAGTNLDALVFGDVATIAVIVLSAFIILLSYALITVCYIVTWVEAYLVMSVGYVLLGFGGSRWTSEYAGKYIGLAVGIGIKVLLLYCLIGAGSGLATAWQQQIQSGGPVNILIAFHIAAGSLIYTLCVWHIPRLFQSVVGGAPNLGHGEVVAAAVATARLGYMAGSAGTAGAGSAGAAGTAGTSGSSAGGSYGAANGASGASISMQVASVKAAHTSVSPPATGNGRE